MLEVQLTQNQTAFIDDVDSDLLEYKWHAQYSETQDKYRAAYDTGHGKILLHRVIVERMLGRVLEMWEDVDHKDLNPLNNMRKNLRLATRSQNMANTHKQDNRSSIFKGVTWDSTRNKWKAQIKVNYKNIFLGRFASENEAAQAYQEAAIQYFGEYARF